MKLKNQVKTAVKFFHDKIFSAVFENSERQFFSATFSATKTSKFFSSHKFLQRKIFY